MIIRIILLLTTLLTFSQESQTITFTFKSNLFAPEYKLKSSTNEVNTIRADVQTKNGNFSIMLIDYNKNGLFNDYRGCCNDYGGSDGVIMLDYNATKSKIMHYNRVYVTKKYPIAINGFMYKLSDLQKNNKGIYTAKITKRIVESKEIFKSRNRLIIDEIPKDTLRYFYSKKKTTMHNLLSKEHKMLFIVSDMTSLINDLQFRKNRYKRHMSKYFKDIEVVRIAIVNKDSRISYDFMLKKFNKYKDEFLTIEVSESQSLLNLGYNKDDTNYILVNEKGVIMFTDLQEFLFINKVKEKANKEKMKNKQ